MALNTSKIQVAVNEYITRHSFNRNIEKLIENDQYLTDLYFTVLKSMNTVQYVDGTAYEYNAIVWYKDTATDKLYLLKSIFDNNTNRPNPSDFMSSGWVDQQENIDIFKYNVKSWLYSQLNQQFTKHENNLSMHPFANLSDVNDILLKNDLSNIRSDRTTNYFPAKLGLIDKTDDILNGYYRIWDCGLLEFDIIYRMHINNTIQTNLATTDIINANDLILTNNSMRSPLDAKYNKNDMYFKGSDNYDIFAQKSNMTTQIGNLRHIDQNGNVNTYYANISFPRIVFDNKVISGFKDNAYAIFASDIMAVGDAQGNIQSNKNSLTYVNKNSQSFTVLYVVTGQNKGLNANSFHCQIVGKWK